MTKPRPHTPEYNRRMSLREPIVEAVFERFLIEPGFKAWWDGLPKDEQRKVRGEVECFVENELI